MVFLTVNLRQARVRQKWRAQNIAQYLSRADRRELVRVSNQQDARARPYGGHKVSEQEQINHGTLVDNQRIAFNRLRRQPE